jgi:hypothetical protein
MTIQTRVWVLNADSGAGCQHMRGTEAYCYNPRTAAAPPEYFTLRSSKDS